MRRTLTATLLAVALALSACNGDDPTLDEPPDDAGETTDGEATDGDAADGAAFPTTVTDGRGVEVEIGSRPERIVSLSPTHTEILYAVGAGDQVVAVDEHSNYPEEAPTTDLSAFEPNVEAILDEDPDLVIVADAPAVAEELEAVDVDVLVFIAATGLQDAYTQMEAVGRATGHADAADELVDGLSAEVEDIIDDTPVPDEPLRFYHELDDTHYSVTSDTFIGEVYALLGLENIADEADEPFPQLSAEAIIEADPDLIFVAFGDPQDVAERPGWESVTAVEEDNLYAVDGDLGSRWGPRIVDFLREVADHVEDAIGRRG